jgi:hypothetical protein
MDSRGTFHVEKLCEDASHHVALAVGALKLRGVQAVQLLGHGVHRGVGRRRWQVLCVRRSSHVRGRQGLVGIARYQVPPFFTPG